MENRQTPSTQQSTQEVIPTSPTETPPPEIYPLPKSKKGAKIVIIALLIFLLFGILASVIGFVVAKKISKNPSPSITQNQPSPPTPGPAVDPDLIVSDWKTYTSNEISFKYPSNMEVFPCGMMGVDQITSVGIKKIGDKTTYCGIGGIPAIFTISTYGESKTTDEYLTKLPLNPTQTISPIQYKTINNFKLGFTTLTTEGGFSTQTHALVNPVDNRLYYVHSDRDWKNNEELLNQILSTFKFTNISPTSSTIPFDYLGGEGSLCYADGECNSNYCKKENADTDISLGSGVCSKKN